jgi:hypothetical protein
MDGGELHHLIIAGNNHARVFSLKQAYQAEYFAGLGPHIRGIAFSYIPGKYRG